MRLERENLQRRIAEARRRGYILTYLGKWHDNYTISGVPGLCFESQESALDYIGIPKEIPEN